MPWRSGIDTHSLKMGRSTPLLPPGQVVANASGKPEPEGLNLFAEVADFGFMILLGGHYG